SAWPGSAAARARRCQRKTHHLNHERPAGGDGWRAQGQRHHPPRRGSRVLGGKRRGNSRGADEAGEKQYEAQPSPGACEWGHRIRLSALGTGAGGQMTVIRDKIRWGIFGTGRIAGWFAEGLALLPDAKLVAVGSRTQKAADDFATRFNVPRRHASYAALAQD